jgi:uncharacterized membrane protein
MRPEGVAHSVNDVSEITDLFEWHCNLRTQAVMELLQKPGVEAVKRTTLRVAMMNLRDLIRATETHARSIAKAISWRATGSVDSFVLAALITGNPKIAGGVALAEIFTKTLLYYVHERPWGLIGWGRTRLADMNMERISAG